MKMEKQKLLIIILVVLVVALASYFAYDFFDNYKREMTLQGYYVAIEEVMNSAKNEKCEPFSVYYGEETINLINMDCLDQQGQQEE